METQPTKNVKTGMLNLIKMVLHSYFGRIYGLPCVVIISGIISTEQQNFVRNLDILQEYILVNQFRKAIQLTRSALERAYQMTNGLVVAEVKITSLVEKS